jgi:hypothetical protein
MLCGATTCFFSARLNRFFLRVEGAQDASFSSLERVDPAPVYVKRVHEPFVG